MLDTPILNDLNTANIMQESLTHLESRAEDIAPRTDQHAAATEERTNFMDMHECSASSVDIDSDDDSV